MALLDKARYARVLSYDINDSCAIANDLKTNLAMTLWPLRRQKSLKGSLVLSLKCK